MHPGWRLPPDWPVGIVGNGRLGLGLVDRFGAVPGRGAELRFPAPVWRT